MKRFLVALGILLSLTACGGKKNEATLSYRLSFAQSTSARTQELMGAVQRVVGRQLVFLGLQPKNLNVTAEGTGAILRVTVDDASVETPLTTQLTAPFTFRVMLESTKEQADFYNEKVGGFRETGITERDLFWITAGKDATGTRGSAVITFKEEGRQKLTELFRKYPGKQIALFVRGHLLSRKLIEANEKVDSLQIDAIPSPDVAAVFADDVNTALSVTFQSLTPAPTVPKTPSASSTFATSSQP